VKHRIIALLLFTAFLHAQRGGGGPQMQLIRQGKLEEALASYQQELVANPKSAAANRGAGMVLDLMGRGPEARPYYERAIKDAPDAAAKAQSQRELAMSYAFSGDCKNTAKYEQMVFDYFVTINDFYQQGEMADEAARVCIDAGDLDTAEKYYKIGHDAGLQEPNISAGRKDLWAFRWEHARARLAARRGKKEEAMKRVAAAKAALDEMATKDEGLANQQRGFLPYLTGYVAYYTGDYSKALEELQKANPNDPFYLCLTGMTYEKLGEKDKALEAYKKASETTAHNPPAAFARPFARKKLGV
jgi:tetratricopeptide (TPR) repeat protein